MASKRTPREIEARNYYIRLQGGIIYKEEEHCPLIIETMLDQITGGTVAAFCKRAVISDTTFYRWLDKYPMFYECYRYAIMSAKYDWEQEGENNKDNPEWDKSYWEKKGHVRFQTAGKPKIRLAINEKDEPYLQYQQLMSQASRGDFTSDELKQVMECLNSGTRVYEAFKVQREVDEMKKDIKEIGIYNGANNIIPIAST